MRSAPSRLAALLRQGHFVVTAELSAIDSPDPAVTLNRAAALRGRSGATIATSPNS